MTAARRRSLAGVAALAVGMLVVAAVVLSIALDGDASRPRLAGVELARCGDPACPDAERALVPAPYGGRLQTEDLDAAFRVVATDALPGTRPGFCLSDVRRDATALVANLAPGRWRVVLRSGEQLWGAVLMSSGDERPAPVRAQWVTQRGSATLSLVSERGQPFETTGTVWSVTGTDGVRVDVRGGEATWEPSSLQVASPPLTPVCRGRTVDLRMAGLPSPVTLDAAITLADGHVVTATVTAG